MLWLSAVVSSPVLSRPVLSLLFTVVSFPMFLALATSLACPMHHHHPVRLRLLLPVHCLSDTVA